MFSNIFTGTPRLLYKVIFTISEVWLTERTSEVGLGYTRKSCFKFAYTDDKTFVASSAFNTKPPELFTCPFALPDIDNSNQTCR